MLRRINESTSNSDKTERNQENEFNIIEEFDRSFENDYYNEEPDF